LPDGNLLLAQINQGLVNGQPRAGLARLLVNAPLQRFEVDPASARVPENGGKVPIKRGETMHASRSLTLK
jgi:hypothetical protein